MHCHKKHSSYNHHLQHFTALLRKSRLFFAPTVQAFVNYFCCFENLQCTIVISVLSVHSKHHLPIPIPEILLTVHALSRSKLTDSLQVIGKDTFSRKNVCHSFFHRVLYIFFYNDNILFALIRKCSVDSTFYHLLNFTREMRMGKTETIMSFALESKQYTIAEYTEHDSLMQAPPIAEQWRATAPLPGLGLQHHPLVKTLGQRHGARGGAFPRQQPHHSTLPVTQSSMQSKRNTRLRK